MSFFSEFLRFLGISQGSPAEGSPAEGSPAEGSPAELEVAERVWRMPGGRPSRQKPPKERGVYRWRHKITGGEIFYIGIADNLSRRKSAHESKGLVSSDTHFFEWQATPDALWADLLEYERQKITHHGPGGNRRGGGGGRPPKRP